MTTEERFERIERITAGLAEERLKDREESRQLWRDTQRQITELAANLNSLTLKVADTNDAIANLGDELRAESQRAHAAEQELRERIAGLVSAIGQFIASQPARPPQ